MYDENIYWLVLDHPGLFTIARLIKTESALKKKHIRKNLLNSFGMAKAMNSATYNNLFSSNYNHYTAEVYLKSSALVKFARKLHT